MPPRARDAATVVLLRDSVAGVEAYLLRRVPTMAFAAGMYVFPGGSVDPRRRHRGLGGSSAGLLGGAAGCGRAVGQVAGCAAVRETFEESGVLLAGPSSRDVVADTTGTEWEVDRAALLDRSLGFDELLDRRGLVLRADLLAPWAHWITPEFEDRRYDTRFFVASMPSGQRTRTSAGSPIRRWMRPADAYDGFRDGALDMLPPTAMTLRELMPHDTVADVLAAATQRTIRPLLPRAVVATMAGSCCCCRARRGTSGELGGRSSE